MAPVVPGRAEGRCGATDRLRAGGGGPGAGGGGAGACASRAGWWWGHRDRVREWDPDADHGLNRPGDADGGRRRAGRGTAAMIPVPSGVRVWLATGYTDMRKGFRSEEHTSELQSLMRISYAVFCLQKKKKKPKS